MIGYGIGVRGRGKYCDGCRIAMCRIVLRTTGRGGKKCPARTHGYVPLRAGA